MCIQQKLMVVNSIWLMLPQPSLLSSIVIPASTLSLVKKLASQELRTCKALCREVILEKQLRSTNSSLLEANGRLLGTLFNPQHAAEKMEAIKSMAHAQ